MAANPQAQRGLVALFKRGWNEIPEVLGSGLMAAAALPFAFYYLYRYNKLGLDNKRYKDEYTVYRPDDPRVAKIRRD